MKRNFMFVGWIPAILLFLGCANLFPLVPYDRSIEWHRCYDGDTCTVTFHGVPPIFGDKIGLRIWGVDTPEKRGKCEQEKALALRAQTFVWDRVKDGRATLHDLERRKYFRIVARVKVADGWLDDLLVKHGLGVRYFGKTKTKDWCE